MTATENEPLSSGPPLPERLISDVETLRALSDPLRLRILEVMTASPDEAFTVKQLATALGTTQTKLYHHVNLLLERDLIAVAGQRVVSGIIETRYRVGQLSLRLDRALLAADSSVMHETLTTVFDGARDEIERGLAAGIISAAEDAAPETKLVLARGLADLAPDQALAFRDRLVALFEEFGATTSGDPQPSRRSGRPYGLLVGFYPMTDALTATDEESDR